MGPVVFFRCVLIIYAIKNVVDVLSGDFDVCNLIAANAFFYCGSDFFSHDLSPFDFVPGASPIPAPFVFIVSNLDTHVNGFVVWMNIFLNRKCPGQVTGQGLIFDNSF